MATYTSNLSLKKPAQSDKIRIADLNGNADNIDAAIGADFGQSSKPSINAAINSLADGLAIVAQGDVHAAISARQFVYVRNHSTLAEGLYVASAAISANAALSGTNLTADTSGGLNALNSKTTPSKSTAFTFESNVEGLTNQYIASKQGNVVTISMAIKLTANKATYTKLAKVPTGYEPSTETNFVGVSYYGPAYGAMYITNTGDIYCRNPFNSTNLLVFNVSYIKE